MAGNRLALVTSALVMALLLGAQGAAATSYTLTVATDMATYASGQTIKITGSVSPAPGPSTAVTLKIINPSGNVLGVYEASVEASSGSYNFSVTAGGSAGWVGGMYHVNATWGAYPPQIYASASFSYSTGTTTTTSTTTTSTTSTTSTSSSTSSSTSTSTSSSSTPTSTTSTSSSSSSTSTSGGGGIPEFPFQATAALFFAAVLAAAYFLLRRSTSRGPVLPAVR